MASTSSSSSHDHERPNTESIQAVVASINQHINEFLADAKTRKSVKSKCGSKLKIQKREFFEFSEHSVLSNLYWGIENIEAAIQSKRPQEKSHRLRNSEQMLQVPALINEHGVTAGISNHYLICCSYFYLSVARKLQGDDWQVALHFLQAVLVSPRLVQRQFLPNLCNSLFLMSVTSEREIGGLKLASLMDFDEDETGEAMRNMARRYKACLTYYQVMSYGETTRWNSGCRDVAFATDESQSFTNGESSGTESSNLQECGNSLLTDCHPEKLHPIDPEEYITHNMAKESKVSDIMECQEHIEALKFFDQVHSEEVRGSSNIKCLQELLTESQSDTPISEDSYNSGSDDEDEIEVYADTSETSKRTVVNADDPQPEISDQKLVLPCSTSGQEYAISLPRAPRNQAHAKVNEEYITNFLSGRSYRSFSALELSIFELRGMDSCTLWNCHMEEGTTRRRLHQQDLQIFNHLTSTALKNYQLAQMHHQRSIKSRQNPYSQKNPNEVCLRTEKGSENELIGILEKAISKLCFSEGLGTCYEDYTQEVVKMYEMLSNKRGVKYTLLKDIILDQLLTAISTSKEVGVIRASVSILSSLVSGNKAVIQDMNKNGLQLCDLASALKRNVHEAAILIHLINPPPTEIKTLELLPTLAEVVCTSNSYKGGLASLLPTPPVASLMIIEVLVTAFDYATNNMHLAAINSPQVLSGLLEVPRNNNLEDFTSLATILVRCMKFDGKCRKYIARSTPVAPFISLLRSNQERGKFIALEIFHEILRMPRSSATNLLQQIRKEGSINNMNILLLLIQQSQPQYKLLAANLLLQLDTLEDSPGKSTYREEAVETLLRSLTCEEDSAMQQLSAFLLSNLGGTYSWTGEPYTVAWLLKKTGLTSPHYRNMIRNFNWLDKSLQDSGIDTWCSKITRSVTKIGEPVFHALEKGLKSRIKKVSRDCLTATAWIGCEIARIPDDLRCTASEILLSEVEQFLHPGFELEDRLLACLCIYNYASGKGMQKLLHFSEGVRESLRRLSNVTWMAEELLRVADYFLPNKWRISCVHTQILEATQNYSGAVTALIYYRGQLCSGYADGSIKVWDIKGQTATLVLDVKEHKSAVTCFSLFEPGECCLLSGSADKTIRIWQMIQRKLECMEVIGVKVPIQSLDTHGQQIFAVTQSHEMKVFDASRTTRDICKDKHVQCVRVTSGKAYVGCMDSSIQELAITTNREREIKAPSKSWRMKSRPINSISVYKDWLYSASAVVVEGSNIKEWGKQSKPQMSMVPDRGTSVLAMEVVEDFIYLNCSPSTSILQIWLRGTQQKVGRLSAGSKITSLLTGNDIILCGTEAGLIKGWIPL
ncbi:putative E3 ubiquitin-protein ligase LIN-1 [Camellia lanceoleosa]|uniref:E3 ubiquitin-protein ligase LIN-1 n=1 Tax=Camellia lanceoleosa TaxID=1840588 RepID=A0ACC0GTP3_9ERIC|nr:putative E3 ubiquitin-protein ligase LIN-1 [Camellia lanceoleosa]